MEIDDLFYSDNAENVLDLFLDVDLIVYVEGKSDICFWDLVFKKTSDYTIELIKVDGCNEFNHYLEKVMNYKINAVIARDSDYSIFLNTYIEHPNIIYTKGYSFENSIINKNVLIDHRMDLKSHWF